MKKTLNYVLAATTLLGGLVGLSSCGGKKDGKSYTYNTFTTTSPSNWCELTYKDENDTQIMTYLGSSFFTYDFKFDAKGNPIDGEFEMKYDAATKLEDVTATYAGNEKYSVPADATKQYAYKITLRDNLTWDDGTKIKASDFVYTMKEQLDPLAKHYRADSFYNSSLVLHNAQNYAKQGSIVDETVSNVFPGIAEAKAAGHKVYLDIEAVTNTLCEWLGVKGTYEQIKGAGLLDQYFAMYEGETAGQNFFDKYDVTKGRIEVTDQVIADYSKCLAWNPSANEEVAMLSVIPEYEYPAVNFEDVGIFVGSNDYEIVLVLDNPLSLLKDDGSLSYKAAYNLSSLPLVKRDVWEANKVAPSAGSTLYTTKYNSSVASTASWGPYKLTEFQSGKQYVLEKNNKWYGYKTDLYKDQYQTTKIVCETIKEYETAFLKFKAGEIDSIGIDVSVAKDYKGSERALYTPDDYVGSMQLQSSKEALKKRESAGVNKTLLSYTDFRKALSLSVNRSEYTKACTTSSLPGFGIFNSMHYYDVENGGVYRNTDEGRKTLCETYGIDTSKYASLEEAEAAITGYDLAAARELLTKAYNEAKQAGDIKDGDKVVLTFGSSETTEAFLRHVDFIKESFKTLAVGTPLEGKIDVEAKAYGNKWADDFRSGAYDICLGGWNGAAWDPGYFLLAYLSPDYMYSAAWDTSKEMMTFTVPGETEPRTMSLMSWYNALNGLDPNLPNWSEGAVDNSVRLALIAALENQILTHYYTVPLSYSFSSSLLSYKVEYITEEYNTFMAYGGLRYMTYNYSDSEWASYLESHTLDYTK